jgi:hypothetical protein
MNKKQLLDLGISEESADQIIVLHGKDIEKHKTDLKAVTDQAADLQTRLEEAGTAIEGFKKLDIEGVQKAADTWKAEAEKAKTDADAKVAQVKFDYALNAALSDAGAKNIKTVLPLLDLEKVKLDEDGVSLSGLKEQLEAIVPENEFLFELEEEEEEDSEEEESENPKIVIGGHSSSVLSDQAVDAARKAAGLPT